MSKVRGETRKTTTHIAPTLLEDCARFPRQDAIAVWAVYPHVYASATSELLPHLRAAGWEETGVDGVVSIHATDNGYVERFEVAQRLLTNCVTGVYRRID